MGVILYVQYYFKLSTAQICCCENMTEWLIIFVLILIVFLWLYGGWFYPNLSEYSTKNVEHMNWLSNDELYNTVDNGDLLFLSGKTRGEHLCCFCTDSMYSHVGMLFREIHPETGENIVYVWESDLGQKTKDGPRIIPLKKKLELYQGQPYAMIRKLATPRPTTENIMNIVGKYQDYDFDTKMINWWVSESWFSVFSSKNTMLCSELVAQTMKELDMLGNKYDKSWYSPQSFTGKIIDGKCKYSHSQYIRL